MRAKRRRTPRRRSAFALAVAALLQLTGCATIDEREPLLTLDACYLQDAHFFSRQFTAGRITISPFNDSISSRQ